MKKFIEGQDIPIGLSFYPRSDKYSIGFFIITSKYKVRFRHSKITGKNHFSISRRDDA